MYEAVTGKCILLHITQHANRYLLMKSRRKIHCLETSLSSQLSTADNNRISHIRLQERIETSSDIGKHFRYDKKATPFTQTKRCKHHLKGTAGTPSESRCRKRLGGRSTATHAVQGLQLCLTRSRSPIVPNFAKQLPKRSRSTTRHKMKKKTLGRITRKNRSARQPMPSEGN